MALLPLWFDVVNRRLVISTSNPDPFLLPNLTQEDIYSIQFAALMPVGGFVFPYFSRVNMTGYTLTISVGSANNALAVATGFTISTDGLLLTGTLSLATAGISALAADALQIFEIQLNDGTGPIRSQQTVTIKKAVGLAGALVPPSTDTALGSLQADRTYMRKEGRNGEGYILKSLNGLYRGFCYWGDDNTMHGDPIA